MAIPRGTRQLLGLREVARRVGRSHETVRYWWKRGRLVGRLTGGPVRKRVTVPIEVVEFYLQIHRLPTRMELYAAGMLTRPYLLDLRGPDGGLSELAAATEKEGAS